LLCELDESAASGGDFEMMVGVMESLLFIEFGDCERAIKYQKQVMSMSGWPGSGLKLMQRRLDLYQQGKPHHEAPPH
jgi:hypothetical protein